MILLWGMVWIVMAWDVTIDIYNRNGMKFVQLNIKIKGKTRC